MVSPVGHTHPRQTVGPTSLSAPSRSLRIFLSGKTLGPKQRIDPYLALQGFTSNAAYQYKEESNKGMIRSGMLADLVELDRNPLKVDPEDLKNIRVLQTIKNGKPVFAR